MNSGAGVLLLASCAACPGFLGRGGRRAAGCGPEQGWSGRYGRTSAPAVTHCRTDYGKSLPLSTARAPGVAFGQPPRGVLRRVGQRNHRHGIGLRTPPPALLA